MIQSIDLSKGRALDCESMIADDGRGARIRTKAGQAGKITFEGAAGRPGGLDWGSSAYLVFDAENRGRYSLALRLEFWELANLGEEPTMWSIIGLLPGLKTRVAFPLGALAGQDLFLKRTPGKLKTVVHGSKVAIEELRRFSICISAFDEAQDLVVGDARLCDEEPDYPLVARAMVDELGQSLGHDWQGRAKDVDEAVRFMRNELERVEAAPYRGQFSSRSAYGGWKGRRFEASGYFRRERDGHRWWLVDPEGCPFYSMGMDVVSPGESGPVEGIEGLHSWLPPRSGAYADAYVDWRGENFFDFGIANLIRAFGEDWWESWARIASRRLLEWGFNSIGNWTPKKVIDRFEMPYVWPLADFPSTKETVFRDFPDVFAPEFEENARTFAAQTRPFLGDRRLIGYFLRNEPEWAFVVGLNVTEELLENESSLASKDALIAFLSERYGGDLRRLNAAWGLSLSSFGELRKRQRKAARLSRAADEDLHAFSRVMIDRYASIPSRELKRRDPDHLNLGMRYAYISGEDIFARCESFDVFSINCYKLDPTPEIERVGARTGLPVMIGEYHFGALDRGPTATGLRAVANQEERGAAFRNYNDRAAATEYCVGAHYFILNDQPTLGRFDGENYQIGFEDVCHRPYEEMARAATECHGEIYELADGREARRSLPPRESFTIAY